MKAEQGRPTPGANPSRRLPGFAVSALWAALLSSSCGGASLRPAPAGLDLVVRPAIGLAPMATVAIAHARGGDLGCGQVTWSVAVRDAGGHPHRVWSASPGSLCGPGDAAPRLVSCGLVFRGPGAHVVGVAVAGVGTDVFEVEVR